MYRKYFRHQTHRRQNDDIYLRVAQEPEHVLIQHRATANVLQCLAANVNFAQEETGAERAVENDQQEGRNQYRE
jgi:hypothetical protein